MREILFRGKREDNGEWLEGNIIINHDFVAIMSYSGCQYWHDIIEVNSSTVGQFTGLTDKTGKGIFEGDVLRIGGKSLPHWLDEGDIKAVEYNEGAFSPLCDYDSDCGMFVESSECEVIGNIHDNPELLGGERG